MSSVVSYAEVSGFFKGFADAMYLGNIDKSIDSLTNLLKLDADKLNYEYILKTSKQTTNFHKVLTLTLYNTLIKQSIIVKLIALATELGHVQSVAILTAYFSATYPAPRTGVELHINPADEFIAIAKSAYADGKPWEPQGLDKLRDPPVSFVNFLYTKYPTPKVTKDIAKAAVAKAAVAKAAVAVAKAAKVKEFEVDEVTRYYETEPIVNEIIASAAKSGNIQSIHNMSYNFNITNVVFSLQFNNVKLFQETVQELFATHRTSKALDVDKYALVNAVLNRLNLKYTNSQFRDKFSNECVLWLINKINYTTYMVEYGRLRHFNIITKYRFPWKSVKFTNTYVTAIAALRVSTNPCRRSKIIQIIEYMANLRDVPVTINDVLDVIKYSPLNLTNLRLLLVIKYNPLPKDSQQMRECVQYATANNLISLLTQMLESNYVVSTESLYTAIENKSNDIITMMLKLKSEQYSKFDSSVSWNDIIEKAITNDYPAVVKNYACKYFGDKNELIKQVSRMPSVDVKTIAAIVA